MVIVCVLISPVNQRQIRYGIWRGRPHSLSPVNQRQIRVWYLGGDDMF